MLAVRELITSLTKCLFLATATSIIALSVGPPCTYGSTAMDASSNPVEVFRVYFSSGSFVLTMKERAVVVRAAALARTLEESRIEVTGHADSVGSDELNETLSQLRAAAVTNELISDGLDASQIARESYGSKQPFITKTKGMPEFMNRRVEIAIYGYWPDPRKP